LENYYKFGSDVNALAHSCINKDVLKELWYGFCYHSSNVSIEDSDNLIFSIGNPEIYRDKDALYCIKADNNGICITSNSEQGLIYGYISLLEKIKVFETKKGQECLGVEYCEIAETPMIENRMIHYCVFPDTKLYELQRFIRLCGALKYSHIVIEFWGMLKLESLKELSWSHAFTKDEVRPLFREANEMGMEVIPMFNHWGHASGSRVMHGKHVVLDQNLKLQPYFSDDGWTWDIQKPEVVELMRSIRNELIEICGEGKYFHLGCDEAYNFEINKENLHIITDYLNQISDEMKSKGRRVIVWGDMFITNRDDFNPENKYIVSCENIELEKMFLSMLSNDIIIADWQYCVKQEPVETGLIIKEAGFDVLLCPWDKTTEFDSVDACAKTVRGHNLFGILHTTWHTLSVGTPDIAQMSDLCWNNDDKKYSIQYYGPRTASIIRRTFSVNGDYEKSGWAPYEVGNKTF